MGLDMYLTKKTYIGANYEHNKVTGKISLKKDGKPIKINLNKTTEISESVCYWRKANHIHNWFVKNVQNGVDDCGNYEVSIQKLKQLSDLCKKVSRCKTEKSMKRLLPTTNGFFFGGTEYDEYYISSCKYTYKEISSLIKEIEEMQKIGCYPTIFYGASW